MHREYFPQILLVLDNTVYLIMHVAHVIYQFFYKEQKSLDTELATWMWVRNGKCFMKPIHSDRISSYCACCPLIHFYQPPVPYASYARIFTGLYVGWSMWFWGYNPSIQLLGICFCRKRWPWRGTWIPDKEQSSSPCAPRQRQSIEMCFLLLCAGDATVP